MPQEDATQETTPVRTAPFPAWPVYDERCQQAVLDVLKSGKGNYWSGPQGRQFQQAFADYLGVPYGIAVANGTCALQMALAACGIGPGDEVITPAYSFIASSTCVLNQGALPIFADVDFATHTIDPADVERKIRPNTKAVICVHLYGHACNMDALMDIADRHDLFVIEDCAQAPGGEYRGKKLGSIGHVGAFSFCQEKIISTGGEGGMVTTKDEKLAKVAAMTRDHGFDEEERRELKKAGSLYQYFHHRMGYNFRLTNMQSALGLVLLEGLDEDVAGRRRNAHRLNELLGDSDAWVLPHDSNDIKHAYYQYTLTLDLDKLNVDRDTFVKAVQKEGIPAALGNSPENYLEDVFSQRIGFGDSGFPFTYPAYAESIQDYRPGLCPVAHDLGQRTVKLKVHPTCGEQEMNDTARAIKVVYDRFRK